MTKFQHFRIIESHNFDQNRKQFKSNPEIDGKNPNRITVIKLQDVNLARKKNNPLYIN